MMMHTTLPPTIEQISLNGVMFSSDEFEEIGILAETTPTCPVAFPATSDLGRRLVRAGLGIALTNGAYCAAPGLTQLGQTEAQVCASLEARRATCLPIAAD